jgi:DNA-binding CsgD family transcriptional regulator
LAFLPSPTQFDCTRNAKLLRDSVRSILPLKALIRLLAQLDNCAAAWLREIRMPLIGYLIRYGFTEEIGLWLLLARCSLACLRASMQRDAALFCSLHVPPTHCGKYWSHNVALLKPLSRREIEILQQIAGRISTREIAAASNTSQQVIKNYTYRSCQKLDADNRTHLIAVAFRAGLIN